MIVWDAPGHGLGDLWAAVSYLAHMEPVQLISKYASRDGRESVASRLREIIDTLDVSDRVIISNEPANTSMNMDCWGKPYWHTKARWRPNTSRTLCVQLDGVSSAHLKNPPVEDVLLLKQWAQQAGVNLLWLGKHYSLTACVHELEKARAFLGVCSGMAHVAHSVGCPVHILEYQHSVAWWHGANPITISHGMQHFIDRFRKTFPA